MSLCSWPESHRRLLQGCRVVRGGLNGAWLEARGRQGRDTARCHPQPLLRGSPDHTQRPAKELPACRPCGHKAKPRTAPSACLIQLPPPHCTAPQGATETWNVLGPLVSPADTVCCFCPSNLIISARVTQLKTASLKRAQALVLKHLVTQCPGLGEGTVGQDCRFIAIAPVECLGEASASEPQNVGLHVK